MHRNLKRSSLPVRLAVTTVLLVGALALAWAVATLVSRSHPGLSPQGSHLRLVPVQPGP